MRTSYQQHPAIGLHGQTIGNRRTHPMELPFAAQVINVRIADGSPAASEEWSVSITDDATQQTWEYTFDSGATLAATLDSWLAAHRANGKANALFSVAEDGAEDFILTARAANRDYTVEVTPGGSATAVVSELTGSGGLKVNMGAAVARGSNDREFDSLSDSSTLADIVGFTFRTDANHFHSLENDSPTAVDQLDRGVTYPIMEDGRMLVEVEDAVAPGDPVYVRRALTSGAGTVGSGFRATPAGSTQVATITVVADHQVYRVAAIMTILGVRHVIDFEYAPTDGTTTTDDAIDGLEDAAAARIAALGLDAYVAASSASAAATMTLTAAAGYSFESVDGTTFGEDIEAEALTVSVAAADVDTIDISSIAQWESSAAAGALAQLRIKM